MQQVVRPRGDIERPCDEVPDGCMPPGCYYSVLDLEMIKAVEIVRELAGSGKKESNLQSQTKWLLIDGIGPFAECAVRGKMLEQPVKRKRTPTWKLLLMPRQEWDRSGSAFEEIQYRRQGSQCLDERRA